MNQLTKIARAATPGTGVQCRPSAYGKDGIGEFLRDVMAMANASVEGSRYIVVGAGFDSKGRRTLRDVDREDFSGKPSYQSLANEYIEPPIRLRYQPVQVDGKRLGVFEIGDCQDRPYMMRADFSERLRRGDAYARVKTSVIKLGRRQLQALFEKKFRDSVSTADIEIGFPGEIIHKECTVNTCDLSNLPSALASNKLQQMMDIRQTSRNSGSTTVMARLTHARLFGSDDPYTYRTPEQLLQEMQQLRLKYRNQDESFLFEGKHEQLQLVVYNQGEEPITDASLAIVMPNHNAFYVAERLPKLIRNDKYVDRTPEEQGRYPAVTLSDDSVHLAANIGDIPVGEPVTVFATPPRICVGKDLAGRKFGMQYTLFGQNLRAPAKGKLRLLFR
jgi:hypothetical protein